MNTKTTPLVTVLIVTYNQEQFIAEAIQGALNQICNFEIEILIGEDCSTDNTLAICQSFATQYPGKVRLIANHHNKGLLNNYFDTLLQARGSFIADCAGDDYWCDPLKLQRQVAILQKYPNVSLTHTSYKEYHQESNTFVDNIYVTHKKIKPQICSFNTNIYDLINQSEVPFVFLGSSCFRFEAFLRCYNFHQHYFRNPLYPCEDYQLIFFLFTQGDFFYEPEVTTVYRIQSESASSTRNISRQLNFTEGSYTLRTDLILNFKLETKQCKHYFYTRLKEILSLCIRLGQKERGAQAIERAIRAGYKLPLRLRVYQIILKKKTLQRLFQTFRQ